uniref:Hypothetical secreted protein n=1 Tax=Simulium vittatum TaxID=7192 RepID=B5M0P4_SIMVI|nr:hypothetical secreted protein [Simulium vittatum]
MRVILLLLFISTLIVSLQCSKFGDKLRKFFKIPPKVKAGPKGGPKYSKSVGKTIRPQDDPLHLDAFDVAAIQNEIKFQKQLDVQKKLYRAKQPPVRHTGYLTDKDLYEVVKQIQFEKKYDIRGSMPRRFN